MFGNILSVIVLSVLLQFVGGAPQELHNEPVEILNQHFTIDPNGESYSYSFEAANGIKEKEDGTLKDVPNENDTGREPAIVVSGSYSYIYNGTTYSVSYTADENGFHPIGDHIAPQIAQSLFRSSADSASPSASELRPVSVAPQPSEPETKPEKENDSADSLTEEPAKEEPLKVEPVKEEPLKVEPVKEEPPKVEPVKEESTTVELVKEEVTTTKSD